MQEQLKSKVANLPKRQQEALSLRYYENLTYDQTMGLHAQSVASLLQRPPNGDTGPIVLGLSLFRPDWFSTPCIPSGLN